MADPTAPQRDGPEVDPPEGPDPGPHFSLSFIQRRALVGFAERGITDWLRVRDFAMEVPDITFPFDVTGGAEKFRHRRCRLVQLTFELDEAGLLAAIAGRIDVEAESLSDLTLAFGRGFLEVSGTVPAGHLDASGGVPSQPGERVSFTAKIAIDASADRVVRLVLHDVRLYGASSLPAPAIALALLRAVSASGLPLEVQAPSLLILDPVPAYLRELLPRQGWKLPDAANVKLTSARIEPGRAILVFDAGQAVHPAPAGAALRPFLSAIEGTVAFAEAERILAEGRYDEARTAYLSLDGPLREHPFAAERTLSLLVAEPTTRGEARDLADAWLERDPSFAPALWARAFLALVEKVPGAGASLLTLSRESEAAGERLAARRAAEAAGRAADAEDAPVLAAEAWERVLDLVPDHPEAQRRLAPLYLRLGDAGAAVRSFGRLTTAGPDAERAAAHLALGRLFSGEGLEIDPEASRVWAERRRPEPLEPELTRAKLHFDAALRMDASLTDAWLGLGRACARRAEPLRAVRCLDEAREGLLGEGRENEAARVAMEIGQLWEHELGHEENALLRYRQVLAHDPAHLPARLRSAELALRLGHLPEAEQAWQEVLRRVGERPDAQAAALALAAQRALAKVARERHGDPAVAAERLEAALALVDAAAAGGAVREALLRELLAAEEARGLAEPLARVSERLGERVADPGEGAALLARAAGLRLELDDVEAARTIVAAARARDPDALAALEVDAALEARGGSPEREAAVLEVLAQRRADADGRARARLRLGHLLWTALGDRDEALRAFGAARAEAQDPELGLSAASAYADAARELGSAGVLAAALGELARREAPGPAGRLWLEVAAIQETLLDDPAAALAALEAARRAAPREPQALWHLGRLLVAAGQPESAHLAFVDLSGCGGPEAAGADPVQAARLMGDAAQAAGDRRLAAEHLLFAWRADPLDDPLRARLDGLLEALGRDELRTSVAREAAEARLAAGDADGAAQAFLEAATLAEAAGREEAAEAACAQALAAAFPPEEALAGLERLGSGAPLPAPSPVAQKAAETLLRLAEARQSPASADAWLALAGLAADPEGAAEALSQRAERLEAQGDHRGALESLGRAVDVHPGAADLRERLAEALAPTDPAAALAHYEALLAARPEREHPSVSARLRLRAGELALSAGLSDQARLHLGLYLAVAPGDEVVADHYVALLRESGDPEGLHDALMHQAGLLAASGHLAEAVQGLLEAGHLAQDALGRAGVARSCFEQAVALAPEDVQALEALLPHLEGPADLGERARLLGTLAALAPDPATATARRVLEGQARHALEELDAASLAFQAALALDPACTEAIEGLGGVAASRGDLVGFLEAAERRAAQGTLRDEPELALRWLVIARLAIDGLGDVGRGLAALDAAAGASGLEALGRDDLEELHRRRLSCHLALGDPAGADGDLTALLDLVRSFDVPRRLTLLRRRARIRESALEDIRGARGDWAELHRLDPRDDEALDKLLEHARGAADAPALSLLLAELSERRRAAGDRDGAAEALAQRAGHLLDDLGDARAAAGALVRAAALAEDPGLAARLRQQLREQLFTLGDIEAAVGVAFDEAAALEPTDAARHLRAVAGLALEADRFDLALRCLRAADARAPQDPANAAALFGTFWITGGWEEAVAPARRLADASDEHLDAALDAGAAEVAELLGRVALALLGADPGLAAEVAQRALSLGAGPGWVDAWVEAARFSGQPEPARQLLALHHGALRGDRRRQEVARRLADLSAALSDPTAELYWLSEARASAPEDLARRISASLAAGDAGRYAEATLAQVDAALAAGEPRAAVTTLAEACTHLRALSAPGEALALLARHAGLRAEAPPLLPVWRAAAEDAGDWDEAARAIEAQIEAALGEDDLPAAAEGQRDLGTLHLERRDDPEAAERAWVQALEHGLRDPEVAARALELARTRGDARAEADLREALVGLSSDPAEAAAHLAALGTVYAGPLASLRAAEASWRAALERDPGQPAAFAGLEGLLEAGGRFADLAALHRDRAGHLEGAGRGEALLSAAAHATAAGDPAGAVADLLAAREADPASFEAGEGEGRLDAARAAAGLHADRVRVRLQAAASAEDPEPLLLEAGDLLLQALGDAEGAEKVYRRAFQVRRSLRAADRLHARLEARDDAAGLAGLALEQAEDAPSGPARAGLLRTAGDLLRDRAGDLDGAIAAYRQAFDTEPGDRLITERLEDALRAAGRTSDLAELTRRLAEQSAGAERAEHLLEAARLHESAGESEAALSCLLEAEAADPERDELLHRVAEALWAAGRRDEAAARHRRILARDPSAGLAYERLTEHLESAGETRELAAVTEGRAAVAEGRLALELELRAMRRWEQAGDPASAARAARRAFQIDPGEAEAFAAVRRHVEGEGVPAALAEVLEAHLEALPQAHPDRAPLLRDAGEARRAAGDAGAARADFDAYLALVPGDAEVLARLAELMAGTGDAAAQPYDARLIAAAEGGARIDTAVLLRARRRLGGVAAAAGEAAAATAHLLAALGLTAPGTEDRRAVAAALAPAALQAGEPRAEAVAQEALALASTGDERLGHLLGAARAWQRAGDHDAALRAWGEAFETEPAQADAAGALLAEARARGDRRLESALLERHAGALSDPTRRRRALLELVAVAAAAGEDARSHRAALEAWGLDPSDLHAARAALPALRARRDPTTLGPALERVAEAAGAEEAAGLWAEATEVLLEAGEKGAGTTAARRALEAARALPELDPELAARLRPAVQLTLASATTPRDEAKVRELAARITEGSERLAHLLAAAAAWGQAEDPAAAVRTLESAAALAGDDPRPHALMASLYLGTGELDKAVEAALDASARSEGEPPILGEVAEAARQAGEAALERRLLEAAVAARPGAPALYERIAALAEGTGDLAGAEAALQAALAQGGPDTAGQRDRAAGLARLRDARGDHPGAAEAWGRVLDLSPADPEAAEALDRHHRSRKDFGSLLALHRARAEALVAAGRSEEAAEAALAASDAAREEQDTDGARQAAEQALVYRPGWAPALGRLRELARAAGDVQAEARILQAAMESAQSPRERAEGALNLARLLAPEDPVTAAAAYRVALAAVGEEPAEGLASWAREIVREGAAHLAGVVLTAGDAAGALGLLDRARAAGATGIELLRIEGSAAIALGDGHRARSAYQTLLEARPDDDAGLEGLARAAALLGDADLELWARDRRAALTQTPREAARRHLALAERARSLGRPEQAEQAEDRALELDPADDRAFEAVLRRLEAAGDPAALFEVWRRRARVVEDEEERLRAFLAQAELARGPLNDAARAAEAYERVLALAPDRIAALAGLAECYWDLGQGERAEGLYRRLPEGAPGLPAAVVHGRLASLEMERGRADAALAGWREAVRRAPAYREAWAGARQAAAALGLVPTEAWALEGLLAAIPEDDRADRLEVLLELAGLERHRLRTEAAVRRYREVRALAPGHLGALAALAELHEGRGEWQDAREVLEQLVGAASDPADEADTRLRLSRLLLERLADPAAALPHLRRVVALEPENVEAWAQRLEVEAPRGDPEAVALCARRLLELGHPDRLGGRRLEAARALWATGERARGAELLDQVASERIDDRALAAEAASALCLTGHPEHAARLLAQVADQTGLPGDRRAAAEAALAAGDARTFVEGLWAGLRDEGMDPRTQAVTARGLADVLAHRLGEPGLAAEALAPFAAQWPDDRPLHRDRARLLDEAGRGRESLDLWLDLGRADPSDLEALGAVARLLEGISPLRAELVRGLIAFAEGAGARGEPADPGAVRVSETTRMELSDPAAAGPVGWFLRAMAPVLEPLFPADLGRFGVSPDAALPEHSEVARRTGAWAGALTDRPWRLFESARLGYEIQVENVRPAALVVGSEVLAASAGERDQLLVRGVELLGAGFALPGRFAGRDVSVLVRLALSLFDPQIEVPVPAPKLAQYHQVMRRLCPEARIAQLAPLASEAAAALPRFDPAGLATAMRRTADRVALLCTGDVPGALEATQRLDPRGGAPGETRREALRAHPALFDLCRFVLREDVEELWNQVRR